MADIKKFLDQHGVQTLWGYIAADIKAEEDRAKAAEKAAQDAAEAAQGEVDALELVVDTKANASDLTALADKVGTVPEGSTVMGIIQNIQENAYDDTELKGLVAGLEANKADKTQVATDIAAAVEAEANRAKGEEARIEGLVTAEANKAREEEGKLRTDLDLIKAFFEGTDFDNKEGGVYDALDSLKEIQDFLAGEGGNVDQLLDSVAKNAEDIAKNAEDIAKNKAAIEAEVERATNAETALANSKADKTEVETAVNGLNEVIATLATKAELTTASQNAALYTDSKFNSLSGTVDTLAQSVAANDAKYEQSHISFSNDISDLKAASHTHANKEVLDGISAEKVAAWDAAETNAKAHATNLNTAMDGRVSAIEGAYLSKDDAASTYETKTDASAKLEAAKAYTDTEIAKIQALSDDEIAAAIAAAKNPTPTV